MLETILQLAYIGQKKYILINPSLGISKTGLKLLIKF